MKKFICLVVLVAIIFEVNAQVSFGAKAAMNVARFRFSTERTISNLKPVVFGGLFGNYKISKKFSTQLDVLGFIETNKTKNLKTGIIASNQNYILRVPLVIQYRVAKRIRIGAGPQIALSVKPAGKPADWRWRMVAAYQVPFAKGLSVSSVYSFSMDEMQVSNVQSGALQFGISYSISRKVGKA